MKQLVKAFARDIARLGGCQLIPDWQIESLPMTTKLRAIFRQFGIANVIDVGANRGQYYNYLRKDVRFEGTIHSFEPDPDLFDIIARRSAEEDPKWIVHRSALGAAEETRIFHRMEQRALNSFLKPKISGSAGLDALNKVGSSFPVTIKPLDAYASEFGDLAHTYLKIDTQGFDLEVMKGASVSIRKIPALQTEISFIPIYDGMPSFEQSIAAFRSAGFCVADLFLVNSTEAMHAIEFDCVMIRATDTVT